MKVFFPILDLFLFPCLTCNKTKGKPIVIEDPDSPQAVAMLEIVEKVFCKLKTSETDVLQPKIVFE